MLMFADQYVKGIAISVYDIIDIILWYIWGLVPLLSLLWVGIGSISKCLHFLSFDHILGEVGSRILLIFVRDVLWKRNF